MKRSPTKSVGTSPPSAPHGSVQVSTARSVGSSAIVGFDDLRAITGYTRLSDVQEHLTRLGVQYFLGRGTISTTVDLLNASRGLQPYLAEDAAPYDPELA